jgi:cyclomaltodextrinase / maltogenic alpha-amylase / neopullulanase
MMRTPVTGLRPLRALAATAAVLGLLLAATAARATQVTFRYQPVIGAVNSVAVAGSFNGWDVKAAPMNDNDKDGVWEARLDLPPGRVEYKFVVNGDQWFTDENAEDTSPDGFGGQNAVLVLKDQPVVAGHGAPPRKAAAAAAVGLHQVPFVFRPGTKVDKVSVAGTFNDWTVGKNPLTGPDPNGDWSAILLLPAGTYQYKFVTGNDGWTPDMVGQDGETDDGYGGKNSVRNVDDRFPMIEVKRGDGNIYPDGVTHSQAANEVNNRGDGRVEFTARAHAGDVDGVDFVRFDGAKESTVPMRWVNRDKVYDYYRAEVAMPAGESAYGFRYRDGAKSWYLTAAGLAPTAAAGRFTFAEARFPAFVTPEWVKNGVFYQIYPERFRNGNPANDPDFTEWYYQGRNQPPADGKLNTDFQEYYHLDRDWNHWQALTQNPYTQDGRDWMVFYGGDIEGVRQKLDYLKDLGVTVIYFNPLFQAKSAHKYDAADYAKIDPHFATNAEFIAFVKEAKAKGIRIVLDIVYNHCGNCSYMFKDAADRGTESPYYTWFEFKRWPLPQGWPNVDHAWKPADYYQCWWGFGDLPALNFDLAHNRPQEGTIQDIKDAQPNIPLVEYLLDTTEYWLKTVDADGVRLDVPNEVPRWFWKLFNERVKRVKPDAYVVGELWGNATDWVKPGVFDAVMNYAFFRDPVTKFLGLGQGTAAEFDGALAQGRLAYPSQAVEVQMNLIDSHDTPRFLTQVNGNVKRLKLAALFAMTYVGAPQIYYGDEVGMEGGKDPDCRRPFYWDYAKDPWRVELLDYYKSLTRARHSSAALRTGDFRTLYAEGKAYAYLRTGAGEQWLVALNAGPSAVEVAVDLAALGGSVKATDALGGATATWSGTARIALEPESGRLFKLAAPGASGSPARTSTLAPARPAAKPPARTPAKAGTRR